MRQLAKSVGISNPYLSQIERGLRAPSEAVIEALAASLDLSVEELYRRAGYRRTGDLSRGSTSVGPRGRDRGST